MAKLEIHCVKSRFVSQFRSVHKFVLQVVYVCVCNYLSRTCHIIKVRVFKRRKRRRRSVAAAAVPSGMGQLKYLIWSLVPVAAGCCIDMLRKFPETVK